MTGGVTHEQEEGGRLRRRIHKSGRLALQHASSIILAHFWHTKKNNSCDAGKVSGRQGIDTSERERETKREKRALVPLLENSSSLPSSIIFTEQCLTPQYIKGSLQPDIMSPYG